MLEREAEQSRIADMLDAAARQQGSVTIVEGEAGIGKSTLLAVAAQRARERGFTVLEARGGALERDFAFGVARQLFEPLLRRAAPDRREALLTDAAGLAGPALGLDSVHRLGLADAVLAAQHGLYWLVDNLAADAPLLLVLDDAHWSDAASLRWLVYLGRRLDGVPAAVLVGWRTGEPGSDLAMLETLRAQASAHTVELRPLSVQAAARIVRERLASQADDAFCAACAQACGGNPFLLGELIDAVREQGLAPAAAAAAHVGRLGPAAVARSVLLRLAQLPPSAARLAEAVAVLHTDATLPLVAALAELTTDEAARAAVSLQHARLLVDGEPLRFAHAILRAAVYEDLPSLQRGQAHGRAARILHARGAATDRVAMHLISASPAADPWAVACLRSAASGALSRGDPDAAADLLARALAEDPDNSGGRLRLELGRATRLAGRPGAIAHLHAALALAQSAADIEEAARELGGALLATSRQDEALAVLDATIARLPAAEHERRLRLEADYLTGASLVNTRWPRLPPDSDVLWRHTEGATDAQRVLLVGLAMYRWRRADAPADEIARAAQAAWGVGRLLRQTPLEGVATFLPIHLLARLDLLDEAQAMTDEVTTYVRARGGASALAGVMGARGLIAYLRGTLPAAEAECRAALHTYDLAQLDNMVHYVLHWLVQTLIDRGDLGGAEHELDARISDGGQAPATAPTRLLVATRGRLRLEQGRVAEARADTLAFLDARTVPGTPGMPIGVRLIAAEACRREGDPATAARLIDDELRAATAVGVPSAIAASLRAQGLLVGGDDGVELLRRSVSVLEASPRRLEMAASLVALGAALRRTRAPMAAREPLRRGLGLAHACGAAALAERAHAELRATGARPRRRATTGADALTATERRVADLACSGMNNRQIAQALFVTRRTVETHLHAAYRKLAVNSRDELTTALQTSVGDPDDA